MKYGRLILLLTNCVLPPISPLCYILRVKINVVPYIWMCRRLLELVLNLNRVAAVLVDRCASSTEKAGWQLTDSDDGNRVFIWSTVSEHETDIGDTSGETRFMNESNFRHV